MVEFGAKLSLKDNMYATLQKNLKMQKQFTSQVNKTSASVKSLGKQKANPVIKAKDLATKTLTAVKNTLKAVGSTTAKAVVAIKDVASAGLSKIKNTLSSLAKGITIGIGIAGAGVSLLAGKALGEGADLQQSIGGVETLFKDDAGLVKANADMAFKTAGLSANSYMEQVTSFSASLLQSLGGDTQKSAQIADMAIIDMADNANKMGTSMDMIQNAYQGFAKQNYTMLDNLKLGYGGTQEEMQRLLTDASKISGVEYDMSNLADVYNAIHVVQQNLGITGTTAKEASETFSGSLATMKASVSNLFGAMAIGGDITGPMEQLVDSAVTFLVNNALPMIGNVFKALPKAISTAIKKVVPMIRENGGEIVQGIKDGILSMLPSSMSGIANSLFGAFGNIFNSVSSTVSAVAPKIMENLSGVFSNSGGFLDGIASAVEMVMPVLGNLAVCVSEVVGQVAPMLSQLGSIVMSVFPVIVSVVSTAINTIMPIIRAIISVVQTLLPIVSSVISTIAGIVQTILPPISQIFTEIGGKIAQVITTVVTPVLNTLKGVFEKIAPVISSAVGIISKVLSVAWKVIGPILDIAMTIFKVLWSILEPIINALVTAFTWLWEKLEPVFSWLGDALGKVGDFIGSIGDWIGGLFGGGDDEASGFAFGKDRVPYDNYPARLHAGEKVLTRNQADQYDRLMSRGVSLTQPVAGAPTSGGNAGGGTINIDKLAETVVIQKEADVDVVVEAMVTKFKQLVPNMA